MGYDDSFLNLLIENILMHFDKPADFYAALAKMDPIQIPRFFVLLTKEEEERKKRQEELFSLLEKKLKPFERHQFQVTDLKGVKEVEQEILSPSFFYEVKVIVMLVTEKILSASSLLQIHDPNVYLILSLDTLSKKKSEVWKSSTMILDLKEEKPWQQKERMIRKIEKMVQAENKQIERALATQIVDWVNGDEGILHQLIENLICYIGENRAISLQDVDACLRTKSKLSSWQQIDALFFNQKLEIESYPEDILGCIAQLRYKSRQILRWLRGKEEGFSSQKNRYIQLFSSVEERFFFDFSVFLFELEWTVKNGTIDPICLVDLIRAKIQELKIKWAKHPSASN